MNEIKVSVAQFIPKLGDKQGNLERIQESIVKAKSEQSQLVILPELFLTGYSVGENVSALAETIDGPY
ncbi:carbon-nitrogen hydrolase family protein, partial [Butyricicoccus sp. 1XD8-22]